MHAMLLRSVLNETLCLRLEKSLLQERILLNYVKLPEFACVNLALNRSM
jgi:hypothetical protein